MMFLDGRMEGRETERERDRERQRQRRRETETERVRQKEERETERDREKAKDQEDHQLVNEKKQWKGKCFVTAERRVGGTCVTVRS